MRKLIISIGFICSVLVINAQKQAPCVVTMNGGNTIEGYIKRYHPIYYMSSGFKLFKSKKQKIVISPNAVTKVVVNDTAVYRALRNKKGAKSLMRELINSKNTSLYQNLIRMSGNVPGEGFATWFINDYYIKRGNNVTHVIEKELLHDPGLYFPNTPELSTEIKATKKKDVNIFRWVKAYNNMN